MQDDWKEPSGNGGFGRKLLTCIALALVFGLVAGGAFRIMAGNQNKAVVSETQEKSPEIEQTPTADAEPAAAQETENTQESQSVSAGTVTDVSGIVENVMPSIVAITNMSQTEYYTWFGQTQTYDTESCGSGIIVADDDECLYIATNNHVISGAATLTICFSDDSTVAAEVKGAAENADLAVVSVKKADLSAETLSQIRIATRGDSETLKVGEPAIAIGNALGYGQSVTTGVISALDREVTISDSETGQSITNELIQTDAAINPGNSGGALLNIRGEVIGINSVKYTNTKVEGMGYAIPMATAGPIIDSLISREVVDEAQSAFLGIVGVDVTEEVSASYGMPAGVYIARISEGSAADQAGLRKGDILTSFDGHTIASMDDLEEQLQYYAAGTTVDLVICRVSAGEYMEQTVSVTLGSK